MNPTHRNEMELEQAWITIIIKHNDNANHNFQWCFQETIKKLKQHPIFLFKYTVKVDSKSFAA